MINMVYETLPNASWLIKYDDIGSNKKGKKKKIIVISKKLSEKEMIRGALKSRDF